MTNHEIIESRTTHLRLGISHGNMRVSYSETTLLSYAYSYNGHCIYCSRIYVVLTQIMTPARLYNYHHDIVG